MGSGIGGGYHRGQTVCSQLERGSLTENPVCITVYVFYTFPYGEVFCLQILKNYTFFILPFDRFSIPDVYNVDSGVYVDSQKDVHLIALSSTDGRHKELTAS